MALSFFYSMFVFHVFRVILEQQEILYTVIEFVSVYMMYDFLFCQVSPYVVFHNQALLFNISRRLTKTCIWVVRTIKQNITFVYSSTPLPMVRFFSSLTFVNTHTGANVFSAVPRNKKILATDRTNPFFFRLTMLFLIGSSTGARAKKLVFLWVGDKLFTTQQTIFQYFYTLVSHLVLQKDVFVWIISSGGNIYKRKEV